MLDRMMKKLAKELEIEDSFATEVPGVYTIHLEENLDIMISELPQGFSLTSTLCPCPKEKEEDYFRELMEANLFGDGTQKAVLGLDEQGKFVTLSRHVEHEVTEEEFLAIIEDFINIVDFWIAETLPYIGTNLDRTKE